MYGKGIRTEPRTGAAPKDMIDRETSSPLHANEFDDVDVIVVE
jgi:hypothetical protein